MFVRQMCNTVIAKSENFEILFCHAPKNEKSQF